MAISPQSHPGWQGASRNLASLPDGEIRLGLSSSRVLAVRLPGHTNTPITFRGAMLANEKVDITTVLQTNLLLVNRSAIATWALQKGLCDDLRVLRACRGWWAIQLPC
jgi:hypothetical protein